MEDWRDTFLFQGRLFILLLGITCVLSSCASIMDPYVAPKEDKFRRIPSFEHAIEYAQDTREAYFTAITEHTQFNRITGLVIIGAAAGAAAVGITGGNPDMITGLAVGGASVFAANSWLFRRSRLHVYAAGAKAISCTLAAFGPVRAADPKELGRLLNKLPGELAALTSALAEAEMTVAKNQEEVIRGRRVRAAGEAILTRGQEVYGLLRNAGTRLYDAVQNIRAETYTALLQSEPDISELARNLSKTIPTNAGLIAGRPLPAAPPAEAPTKFSLDSKTQKLVDAVKEKADAVEVTSGAIETILAIVGTPPSAAEVSACGIDAAESGLLFSIDPPTQLVIDTSAENRSGDILVSGGKGPYHARWIGQDPGNQLALMPPDHSAGGSGRAIVTVTAKEGAGPATYRLLVFDENSPGRASILISLAPGSGSAQQPAAKTATRQPAATTANPDIKKIQTTLIELKCLKKLRADGKPNDDGIWGKNTDEAFDRLLKVVGEKKEDVNQAASESSGSKFNKVVLELLDTAKAINKQCSDIEAQPDARENASSSMDRMNSFEATLSFDSVAKVQSALGLPRFEIDGILGQSTREAISEFQKVRNKQTTGALTEPLFKEIINSQQEVPGAKNDLELSLSSGVIEVIQNALGMTPATGVLDVSTRSAIKQRQTEVGTEPTGILTKELVREILSRPPR